MTVVVKTYTPTRKSAATGMGVLKIRGNQSRIQLQHCIRQTSMSSAPLLTVRPQPGSILISPQPKHSSAPTLAAHTEYDEKKIKRLIYPNLKFFFFFSSSSDSAFIYVTVLSFHGITSTLTQETELKLRLPGEGLSCPVDILH